MSATVGRCAVARTPIAAKNLSESEVLPLGSPSDKSAIDADCSNALAAMAGAELGRLPLFPASSLFAINSGRVEWGYAYVDPPRCHIADTLRRQLEWGHFLQMNDFSNSWSDDFCGQVRAFPDEA
jgi:hypothetical protein